MSSIAYPCILWNENKLIRNANYLVNLAMQAGDGVQVTGVTKAVLGSPSVARAMLKGRCTSIADSRVRNLRRLAEAGIRAQKILIRGPMLSEVDEVVRFADISMNSEISVIEALSKANMSYRPATPHKIILMVEMGDLREGLYGTEEVEICVEAVLKLKGVEIIGLGATYGCLSGVIPDQEKIDEFSELVDHIEAKFDLKFEMISGGTSSIIPRLLQRKKEMESNPNVKFPPLLGRVTHIRLGESILLGKETVNDTFIPGCHPDTFIVKAEVIENQLKPSHPFGELSGHNALGHSVDCGDDGGGDGGDEGDDVEVMQRALVALGEQDVDISGLQPLEKNCRLLNGSSDHAVLEILLDEDEDEGEGEEEEEEEEAEEAEEEEEEEEEVNDDVIDHVVDENEIPLPVGHVVSFLPNYSALMRAFTSPFMIKVMISARFSKSKHRSRVHAKRRSSRSNSSTGGSSSSDARAPAPRPRPRFVSVTSLPDSRKHRTIVMKTSDGDSHRKIGLVNATSDAETAGTAMESVINNVKESVSVAATLDMPTQNDDLLVTTNDFYSSKCVEVSGDNRLSLCLSTPQVDLVHVDQSSEAANGTGNSQALELEFEAETGEEENLPFHSDLAVDLSSDVISQPALLPLPMSAVEQVNEVSSLQSRSQRAMSDDAYFV